MGNQDGSPLESAIERHQRLIEQDGNLVQEAIRLELEKARIEAEAKKTPQTSQATQIISAPQTPVSGGYAIRDIFRPLEALVQQGPASFGGVENYRSLVFERISNAVGQIHPGLGGSEWTRNSNGGWSNDKYYICLGCNTIQSKAEGAKGEKLITHQEYLLIYDAFKLAHILLHEDTSSCSEQPKTAGIGAYIQPTGGAKEEVPTLLLETPEQRQEEIEALKKSIGGEWYTSDKGGWWNSSYLICLRSGKVYSRQTGESVNIDVARVMRWLPLSVHENLCPTSPFYQQIALTLPEAAKVYAQINCSACKAPQG